MCSSLLISQSLKNMHHKVLSMLLQAGFLLCVAFLGGPAVGRSLGSLKADQLPETTCYNASHPAAVNATIVYDFYDNDRDLWTRDPGSPLPLCSSSFSPNSSRCSVCRDGTVFIVCRHLAEGAKVTMEAGAASISIKQSDCPKLLSDGGDPAPLGTRSAHIIAGIAFAIILIIVVAVLLVNRQRRGSKG
ncbi:uncharacterized protein PAE49_016635 isoform 2-T2 [Odontesthes bonariensis]